MKEYEECIRRNPKEPKYYGNKATCLIKLMEFPSALNAVEKALELDPKNVKFIAKKGQCHFGMREYHKA
jgi:stress-induced-phosphoprotein 1